MWVNLVSLKTINFKKMKKSTFLLVIILLATNILKAAPAVIYVNDNASGDNDGSCWADAFTTLQAALDSVQQDSAKQPA